jgi:dTDP-4-dehydrorhamnose reductase
MTVLVLGASGLLGSNVAVTARQRNNRVVGTYHTNHPDLDVESHRCNLENDGAVANLVDEHDPDLVVNCAAIADVDECERDPEAAREINSDAPGRIAELCDKREVSFVHISTDYVFDGERRHPYSEDHTPNPIQTYGRTKRAGERAVFEANADSLILRLSFVYGIHRSSGDLTGFPVWVRDELCAGNEVPLFTDQHITPSRAGQVADTVFDLVATDKNGFFHVTCRSCVTPYQFGQEIASRVSATGNIVESSRTNVDQTAPRPEYNCLDVDKVETTLDRSQPTLDEDLDKLTTF